MARHAYVERTDVQEAAGSGLVITLCILLLLGIVALFTVFGGPARFIAGPTPPVANVNVPAQSEQRNAVQPLPHEINVNQAPAGPGR